MPNSDDFLVVAKILVAKDQNSCSATDIRKFNSMQSDTINFFYKKDMKIKFSQPSAVQF